MNNISGSASNWISDNQVERKPSTKNDNDVVVETKDELDKDIIKGISKELEKMYKHINDIHSKFPKKDISDSSILLKSAIDSLKKSILN
jgi:rubrerythrin